ncbi:MAG: hypothetical protein J5542_02375 [Bacteroidales bacterium]|nr:hypothetical protein [Bacteroidales bacterium]
MPEVKIRKQCVLDARSVLFRLTSFGIYQILTFRQTVSLPIICVANIHIF